MSVLGDVRNQMVEMRERMVNTGDDFSDPQNTYATITRKEYEDFVRNFGGFEDKLIADTRDTSLIDRAEEEARTQSRVAEGIQQRNIERVWN